MYIDHIANAAGFSFACPLVVKVLSFLSKGDFSSLGPDQAPLRGLAAGHGVTAAMFCLATGDPADCRAEVHRRYADIHYVLRGNERIGAAVDTGRNHILLDEIEKKDALFYADVEGEFFIEMTEGMFAFFLPQDVHRPGCRSLSPEVTKVVVKIPVSGLQKI